MDYKTPVEVGAFDLARAAAFAGVSTPTMAEWVNREDFPAFKAGRRWIIPREAFIEWLTQMANQRITL